MRSPVLLFLLIFNFFDGIYAQHQETDSLQTVLKKTTDKREKVLILHKLASQSWDFSFDAGLAYAHEAHSLAEDIRDVELLTITLTDIGQYYYFTGNYQKAHTFFREALHSAGKENFGEYPSYTLTRLGNLFRSQGLYDSARFYYSKALALTSNGESSFAKASVHHNIAWLHYEVSEYSASLTEMRRSLKIRTALADSLLIAECWKFMGMTHRAMSNFDSAVYYLSKVERIAKSYNDPELHIFYLIHIGELSFDRGDMVKTIDAYSLALELLNKHPFKRYQALTLKKIGQVYYQLGDCERAQSHYFDALKIEEQLHSSHEIARTYANIGWCYTLQRGYVLGEQYAQQSLVLMRKMKDKVGVAFAQNLIGTLALRQQQFEKALLYFDSALVVRRQFNLLVYEASSLENKGYVFEARGEMDKTLAVQQEALGIYEKAGNQVRLVTAYNNMGALLFRTHSYDQAVQYLEKAKSMALSIGFLPELKESYFFLAKIKKNQNSFEEASNYFEEFVKISDSLHTMETRGKAAQVNALYELEKKEKRIKELDLENLRKADELTLKEATLRNRNLLLAFVSAGIVFLTLLSIVLYKYYLNKKKANTYLHFLNTEINEQKEEILTQSEELTEANNALVQLNDDLVEKQKEITEQAEELVTVNQNLAQLNGTLERRVEERTNELKQAYMELDTFFYRSSHDFRRPLTTFMGLAEVAKVTVKDKSAIDLFDKVRETAVYLDKMLMKLQSISDVGLQQLTYKEVQLTDLVDSLVEAQTCEIKQRGIKISTDLQQTVLTSYPALLKIIIENLLENAVFFSKPGTPQILIRTKREGDTFVFEVEDNGQGIDPEYQSRIFDMYYRANLSSKGNGLGLYIVKKAVQKLGGTITFTSQISKGSCFTIKMPIA